MSTCTICTDLLHRDLLVLGCGHVFHRSCLTHWFSIHRSCPNCKQLGLSITNLHINPENLLNQFIQNADVNNQNNNKNPWEILKLSELKLKLQYKELDEKYNEMDNEYKQMKYEIGKLENDIIRKKNEIIMELDKKIKLKSEYDMIEEKYINPLRQSIHNLKRELSLQQLKYIKLFQHRETANSIRIMRNSLENNEIQRPEENLPLIGLSLVKVSAAAADGDDENGKKREKELQEKIKGFVMEICCRWLDHQTKRIGSADEKSANESPMEVENRRLEAELKQELSQVNERWRSVAEKKQYLIQKRQELREQIHQITIESRRNAAAQNYQIHHLTKRKLLQIGQRKNNKFGGDDEIGEENEEFNDSNAAAPVSAMKSNKPREFNHFIPSIIRERIESARTFNPEFNGGSGIKRYREAQQHHQQSLIGSQSPPTTGRKRKLKKKKIQNELEEEFDDDEDEEDENDRGEDLGRTRDEDEEEIDGDDQDYLSDDGFIVDENEELAVDGNAASESEASEDESSSGGGSEESESNEHSAEETRGRGGDEEILDSLVDEVDESASEVENLKSNRKSRKIAISDNDEVEEEEENEIEFDKSHKNYSNNRTTKSHGMAELFKSIAKQNNSNNHQNNQNNHNNSKNNNNEKENTLPKSKNNYNAAAVASSGVKKLNGLINSFFKKKSSSITPPSKTNFSTKNHPTTKGNDDDEVILIE